MAITISQNITGVYPAYNDSWIIFSSDLTDNFKAEIEISLDSLFENTHLIYPDSDGNYYFNFKEFIKVYFNQFKFEDYNYDEALAVNVAQTLTGILKQLSFIITVYNDTTDESDSDDILFVKSVRQIGENLYNTSVFFALTQRTSEDIYNAIWFYGFPFTLDLINVDSEVELMDIKNNSTTDSVEDVDVSDDQIRLNVDLSNENNWIDESFLTFREGINEIELTDASDDSSLLKVYINKITKCKGIYLKWLNRYGGYSYYLFDEFYTDNLSGKTIDTFAKSEFKNIEDLIGTEINIGKNAARSINAKARYENDYLEMMQDLIISPSVQMYSSMLPNVPGTFIDVNVDGNLSYNNKKGRNKIDITIDLPEVITAKY